MAVYKSTHKGSQIDNAVSAVLYSKGKGDNGLPIYFDANSKATPVTVDDFPMAGSDRLINSDTVGEALDGMLSLTEIQTDVSLGESELPPSQRAVKIYTDTQVVTKQPNLISSETVNVAANGEISVTAAVIKNNDTRVSGKSEYFDGWTPVVNAAQKQALDLEDSASNRIEVDVIKADDFTANGSISVTGQGITATFSTTKYISKANAVTLAAGDNFLVTFKAAVGASTNDQYLLDFYASSTDEMFVKKNANEDTYTCACYVSGNGVFTATITCTDEEIYCSAGYVDGKFTFTINGITEEETVVTPMSPLAYNLVLGTRVALGTSLDPATNCYAYLSYTKVIVNDVLKYQACLRIPYKFTKSGKKLVTKSMLAQDMYEEFGYNPYYVELGFDPFDSSLHNSFIPPTNEQEDIIYEYKNGVTSYVQRANLHLEQRGTAIIGTAVTFPKPFRDNNYTLTIPYSAKSATGFTPDITGDWIAEGFCTLG